MNLKILAVCVIMIIALLVPWVQAHNDYVTVDQIAASPGTVVCVGDTVELSIRTNSPHSHCTVSGCSIVSYEWFDGTTSLGGGTQVGDINKISPTLSATGTKTFKVTATCNAGKTDTETKDITAVEIASITNGTVTSSTDSPGDAETIYVLKGDSDDKITLTALPTPSGSSFPTDQPAWSWTISGSPPHSSTGPTADFPIDAESSDENGTLVTATCGVTIKIKVVVDLNLDMNNAIFVTDAEEETTGGFIALNDNDDNENGTEDRLDPIPFSSSIDLDLSLTQIILSVKPSLTTGSFSFKANAGGTMIKVWSDWNKDIAANLMTLPATWSTLPLPTSPKKLCLEGITESTSLRDIELELSFTPTGATYSVSDKAKLTVIDPDWDEYSNQKFPDFR